MSAKIEGAINGLTAAVIALAVAVEKQNVDDSATAQGNVEYQYERALEFLLDH